MGWDHNWTVFFLGLLASFCLFASLALKMFFFEKMGWDGNFIGKIGMGRKKLEIQLENMGWGDSWIPSFLGLLGYVCL